MAWNSDDSDHSYWWHQGTMGDDRVLVEKVTMPVHLTEGQKNTTSPYNRYSIQVKLANSDEPEEVLIDGGRGPRGINLDGNSYHCKYWPIMSVTEKEILIHTVAKKNRSMREYQKNTELKALDHNNVYRIPTNHESPKAKWLEHNPAVPLNIGIAPEAYDIPRKGQPGQGQTVDRNEERKLSRLEQAMIGIKY